VIKRENKRIVDQRPRPAYLYISEEALPGTRAVFWSCCCNTMFLTSLSSSNHDRDKHCSVVVAATTTATPKTGGGWLGALRPIIRTSISMEMEIDDDDHEDDNNRYDDSKEDEDENDSMGQSPLRPHRQQQLLLRQQFPVAAAAAAAVIAATTASPYNHNHHTYMPSTILGNGHGTDSAADSTVGASNAPSASNNHNTKNLSSHEISSPPRHKRLGSSESASSTSSTVSTATSSVTTSTPWLLPTSSTHTSTTATTSTPNTATTSNHKNTSLTKDEAEQYKLKTQQKIVIGSLGAVLNFLKCNAGVSTASLEQLEKNVHLGRYFAVLCRAQEYLQLLQPPTRAEAEAQMFLATSAWEALCQWKAIHYRRAYNYAFRLRFETDQEGNPICNVDKMGLAGGISTPDSSNTTTTTTALSHHSHHRQDLQQQQQQQQQQQHFYDNSGDIYCDYDDEDHWDGHCENSDNAEEYPDESDTSQPSPPPLLSRAQTQQQRQHQLDIQAAIERQVKFAEQCTACQKRLYLVRVWQERLQHHLQWKERQQKRQEQRQKHEQQQLLQVQEHGLAEPIK
jgi:hypothetical protein